MPSPEVRYCTTEDGVRIAVWMLGEGPPLILTPGWWALASATYEREDGRVWLDKLARSWRVIRYDNRGTGESQRDAQDFSLDARVRDLEGVVDKVAPGHFVLLGYLASGPASIVYANRYPERVSHLMLWCTTARGSDMVPGGEAAETVAETDWQTYLDSMSLRAFGWSSSEAGRRGAEVLKNAFTREAGMEYIASLVRQDTTSLLPALRVPTLVLQRRQATLPDVADACALAAQIPGAKFVIVDGDSAVPYVGDADAVLREIEQFTGVGAAASTPAVALGLRTILVTDLVRHTEMMQRLGDDKGRDVLREHERITRETLAAHAGAEVKTMGDGFMASFGSVTKAMDCAIALQRAFVAWNADVGATGGRPDSKAPLNVRVGLNAGEPIAEDGDLFGSTVIMASRICALAGAGEILVPDPVRHLLSGKDFLFSDRGDSTLKGFEDPIRLYEVRWQ